MKDEELANMIYQAKENRELIQTLINRFQPLINYYCKKLFFLESDDAKQELYLAIIESIKSILVLCQEKVQVKNDFFQ